MRTYMYVVYTYTGICRACGIRVRSYHDAWVHFSCSLAPCKPWLRLPRPLAARDGYRGDGQQAPVNEAVGSEGRHRLPGDVTGARGALSLSREADRLQHALRGEPHQQRQGEGRNCVHALAAPCSSSADSVIRVIRVHLIDLDQLWLYSVSYRPRS